MILFPAVSTKKSDLLRLEEAANCFGVFVALLLAMMAQK